MALYQIADGRVINLPEGMSEGEIINFVASAFPDVAALTGIYPDVDREFNFNVEFDDPGFRFDLAVSNSEEYANLLDNKFGKGNWGITDYGKAYVTPEGLRVAGKEPEDNRKVLIDSAIAPLGISDLADIGPELIKGTAAAAATAASAALAPLTGGGSLAFLGALLGRSVLARGVQVGVGDVIANLGLEGYQTYTGNQLETVGEQIQDAGIEGLMVGLGQIAFEGPIQAIGAGASRLKQLRPTVGSTTVPQRLSVQNYIAAKDAASTMVSPDDVPLFTLHTLMQDSKSPLGSVVSRLEATGKQFGGGTNLDDAANFVSKMVDASNQLKARTGGNVTPDQVMAHYKSLLSKADIDTANKIVKTLENYPKSSFGSADYAAKNIHVFRNNATMAVKNQYNAFQRVMSGKKYYGSPIITSAEATEISSANLANLLNRVSKQTGFGASKVEQIIGGVESKLGSRISSRVKVDPKTDKFVSLDKKARGSNVTVGDIRERDINIRKSAFMKKDISPSQTRENLEFSVALNKAIESLPGVGPAFREQMRLSNAAYAQGSQVFRGKNGLFSMFETGAKDAQGLINKFVNGGLGSDIDTLINNFNKAFSKNFIGSSDQFALTLKDADELLAQLGHTFTRDLRSSVATGFSRSLPEGKAAASKALKTLNDIEDSIKKQGSRRTGVVVNKIFGLDYIKDFKKLLRDASSGDLAKNISASNAFKQAFDYSSTKQLITEISSAVNNLANKRVTGSVVQRIKQMKQVDPKGAEFYQDLSYAQSIDELMEAFASATPEEQLAAVSKWTQNWVNGRQGNMADMAEIFGRNFANIDAMAVTLRGATEYGRAGSLFTAELPFSLLRAILKQDVQGAIKPMSLMYALKGIGPGSDAWKTFSKQLEQEARNGASKGQAIQTVMSKNSPMINSALKKAKRSADFILSGRAGFNAAVIGSMLEELNDTLPEYGDFNPVAPKSMEQFAQEQQAKVSAPPAPQMIPQDTGVAAIQQIASMLQQGQSSMPSVTNIGQQGLAQGAAIARGR